jgi:glycerate kinase
MNITGAESRIKDCDIVITGEGRMDSQTVNGKAPFKILQNAKKYGKPVYGITGILGDGYEECLKAGFTCIEPLIDPTMVTEEAVKSVEETAVMLSRSFPDNSPNMETVLKR